MTDNTERARGSYVDANGVRTYFEVDGAGDPLLLLHGGLCTIETLDGLRRVLASEFQLYLPERRGHGRTPDIDGPFSFGTFADDTISFMETVGLSSAHVVGFSDGATVGLLTALRRPDLVRSLVHIGQQVNPDGMRPEFREMLQLEDMPNGMLPPVLQELYSAVSPDGADHWAVVTNKVWQMIRTEPNIGLNELRAVTAPTLVVVADQDIATVPHAEEMCNALANARLAVVPGATHGLPMEKPDVVGQLVLDFLAAGD